MCSTSSTKKNHGPPHAIADATKRDTGDVSDPLIGMSSRSEAKHLKFSQGDSTSLGPTRANDIDLPSRSNQNSVLLRVSS